MSQLLDHGRAAVVGYFAAIIAAAFSYTFLLALAIHVTGSIENPSDMPIPDQFRALLVFAVLATSFIGVPAAPPFIVAAILIIVLNRRDIVSHVLAGMAVSAVTVWLVATKMLFMEGLKVDWITLSAGTIGGIAYWIVGRWLGPREARAPAA